MKTSPVNYKPLKLNQYRRWVLGRCLSKTKLAVTLIILLASGMVGTIPLSGMVSATANASDRSPALSSDKKVIHLLNRIAYGPRPGDVEAVKRMGIDKYIDQQVHPERINDSALEARLASLEKLHTPIAQLYDKYPQPGLIARNLGIKGRAAANAQKSPQQGPDQPQDQTTGAAGAANQASDTDSQQQQQENRQMIQQYYAKHGLKPPQGMLMELQAQKLI